jgi:DNA-directed RNA polymerase specialized sigma24 family protein
LLRSEEAAKDLSQDVAVAALKQLDKEPLFFNDQQRFFAWCRKRARWLALDRIRYASRRRTSGDITAVADRQAAADELAVQKEALTALEAAIARLPATQKDVVLRIVDGIQLAKLRDVWASPRQRSGPIIAMRALS